MGDLLQEHQLRKGILGFIVSVIFLETQLQHSSKPSRQTTLAIDTRLNYHGIQHCRLLALRVKEVMSNMV